MTHRVTEDDKRPKLTAKERHFALVVSGLCLLVALLGALGWLSIDNPIVLLLFLAILPWVFPYVSKFKAGGFEVELREKVEMMLETASEPDEDIQIRMTNTTPATTAQSKVLQALTDSRYSFRTVSGIKSSTGLSSKTEVSAVLIALQNRELVRAVTGKQGNELWAITALGRSIAKE